MIHKEGPKVIAITILVIAGLYYGLTYLMPGLYWLFAIAGITAIGFTFSFFRNPKRTVSNPGNNPILAPADGEIVVIEKIFEPEYFHDERIQISIFMSPLNVHVNRYPTNGIIEYVKYHPGKHFVAWHPKSSTKNERSTIVINNGIQPILLRQIAGAMARRIVTYAKVDDQVLQGRDLGFIKFGSRVDLFLPLNTQIDVEIGQAVRGNETIIGRMLTQP